MVGLFAFARRVGSVSVNVMTASKVSVSEHLIHTSGVGVAEAVAKGVGVPICAFALSRHVPTVASTMASHI